MTLARSLGGAQRAVCLFLWCFTWLVSASLPGWEGAQARLLGGLRVFLYTHVQKACTKEADIHVQWLHEGPKDARSFPVFQSLPSPLSGLHLLPPGPASLANIARDASATLWPPWFLPSRSWLQRHCLLEMLVGISFSKRDSRLEYALGPHHHYLM